METLRRDEPEGGEAHAGQAPAKGAEKALLGSDASGGGVLSALRRSVGARGGGAVPGGGAGAAGAAAGGDTAGTDCPREEERAEPWAPVPESAPVTDDYFDDAAFVGDSRTDGFRLYSGLDRGVYFCVTGETVASAVELSHWKEPDGTKIPLADAVAAAQCGKDLPHAGGQRAGLERDGLFRERAGALLARLRADHPQAAIAIQSLLPVTAAQDQKGTYVNNRRIQAYNQVWRELAEEGGYFYLDVAQALTGEDGCLPDAVSYDGVHLNREGCRIWLHYLRLHRVPAAEPAE